MRYVNLTPHAVDILAEGQPKFTIAASGDVARVSFESVEAGTDLLDEGIATGIDGMAMVPLVRNRAAPVVIEGRRSLVYLECGPDKLRRHLPTPQEGVVLIVSGLVLDTAARERETYETLESLIDMDPQYAPRTAHDLAAPGDLVRDAAGRPIGCRNLRVTR